MAVLGQQRMGLIGKVTSRLRRDAGFGLERTYLYELETSVPRPPAVSPSVPVRIDLVPAADIERLSTLGVDDRAEWDLRLRRGDECYGAWLGSELVHYSWVQTRGRHVIASAAMDVSVRPAEPWIYNCRTAVAHRGQRIYPRTLQRIVDDKRAEGCTAVWIYAAEDNVASQRGFERAGFLRVQTLVALRLGRRYRALSSASAGASAVTI
jgi:hypothetical protein